MVNTPLAKLAVVPVTVTPVITVNAPETPVTVVNCAVVPVTVWPLVVPVTEIPELKNPEPLTVKLPAITALVNARFVKLPVIALTVVPVIVVPVTVVKPAVLPVIVVN